MKTKITLTAIGKTYAKASIDEINPMIYSRDPIDYQKLMGIVVNPELTPKMIDRIFDNMDEDVKYDNVGSSTFKAERQKLRIKAFDALMIHPNMDDRTKTILIKGPSTKQLILKNPGLSEEHLQTFFDKWVFEQARNRYSFLFFELLVKSASKIDGKMLAKWYVNLKPYADWTYGDNEWYSFTKSYVEHKQCPFEVLKDIASAPMGKDSKMNPLGGQFSERYRALAVDHKNSTEEIRLIAYEITQDVKYLPQEAQDIFLF